MTFKQFLVAFRTKRIQDGAPWVLRRGTLRTHVRGVEAHCPLSFTANTSPCSIEAPAARLKIARRTAILITDAADNWLTTPTRVRYRKALIKAAGL